MGDVDVQDDDGDTPLFLVEDVETAKVLVEEFGADAHRKNKEGLSVSEALEENGWSDVAKYIREITGEKEPVLDEIDEGDEEDDEDEDDEDVEAEDVDDQDHNGVVTKKYVELLSEYGSCEVSVWMGNCDMTTARNTTTHARITINLSHPPLIIR